MIWKIIPKAISSGIFIKFRQCKKWQHRKKSDIRYKFLHIFRIFFEIIFLSSLVIINLQKKCFIREGGYQK